MGIFNNRNKAASVRSMTEDERTRMIERLETERLYVTLDIEEVMAQIARITGKRRYRLKGKRLGTRAQDYIPEADFRR